jgi:hypothetical protein
MGRNEAPERLERREVSQDSEEGNKSKRNPVVK